MRKMRPSICQGPLSSFLGFLNYLQTFVGLLIVLYSIWMLNDWSRHGLGKSSAPWFVYTVMSVGILPCLIAFMGYIAAGVLSGCCLCTYAVFTSTLILVEATLVADLAFNKHWEEDFPHDATGKLKSLQAFIEANIDIFKLVAVTVVVVQLPLLERNLTQEGHQFKECNSNEDFILNFLGQAFSLFLAIILRGMVSPKSTDDESDEDFPAVRSPLLNPQGTMASASTSVDSTMIQSDSWSSRMRQKYGLVPSRLLNDVATRSSDRRKCSIL